MCDGSNGLAGRTCALAPRRVLGGGGDDAGGRGDAAATGRRGAGGAENGRMACGDAPRPPVRLHLIDRAGLSIDARFELMRETLAPWRAAGASVEWVVEMPARPAGLGEPKDLYVVVGGRRRRDHRRAGPADGLDPVRQRPADDPDHRARRPRRPPPRRHAARRSAVRGAAAADPGSRPRAGSWVAPSPTKSAISCPAHASTRRPGSCGPAIGSST